MKKYSLFDKEMQNYYIKAPKYITLVCLIVCLFFFVITFWVRETIYFFVFMLITVVLFNGQYILGKKRYGNKISINSEGVGVYSINDKFLYFLKFSEIKKDEKWILFDGPRASFEKKCLIFYCDIVVYEKMEYKSYWRNKSILFIQNAETITLLS